MRKKDAFLLLADLLSRKHVVTEVGATVAVVVVGVVAVTVIVAVVAVVVTEA